MLWLYVVVVDSRTVDIIRTRVGTQREERRECQSQRFTSEIQQMNHFENVHGMQPIESKEARQVQASVRETVLVREGMQ